MMIYVIMKGCYSDRTVVSATLDKATAEKIRKELLFENSNETVNILEFQDARRLEQKTATFLVKFDMQMHYVGMVQEILKSFHELYSDIPEQQVTKEWDDSECEEIYVVRVKAENAELAKKIACDLAAEYQYQQKCGE